jgi:hypothetical protein
MNTELERIWKETAVSCFVILITRLLGRTDWKPQDGRCPYRGFSLWTAVLCARNMRLGTHRNCALSPDLRLSLSRIARLLSSAIWHRVVHMRTSVRVCICTCVHVHTCAHLLVHMCTFVKFQKNILSWLSSLRKEYTSTKLHGVISQKARLLNLASHNSKSAVEV